MAEEDNVKSESEDMKKKDSDSARRMTIADMEKEIKSNTVSIEQLHQWFKEQIERRDAEIEQLKKDNEILFNTAMKANEKNLPETDD
ncbi:hypothetical protein H6503_05500 [Candidatus Woesearchaeota archaeon]|nr:hypothetical protein [Candidatus Woesearchaeota archaeon]